jgi:hypothetical protein
MGGNDDGIRPIVMRYADVLLMFAEAQNELEGPTTPHNGLSAQNALRRVRERAFDDQSAVSAYIANVSASPERFFQAIMDERAFEFLGEQRRNYDLNRWNRLQSEMDWARRQTLRLREGLAVGSGGRLSNIPGDRDIDFSEFPRHIFWRHVPHPTFGADVQILEIFGMRRGEFPRDEGGQIISINHEPHTPSPELIDWMTSFRGGETNRWNPYQGTGEAQIEWIDRRNEPEANNQNNRPLSDLFIDNAFYYGNLSVPLYMRSLFPLWARQISDSQGDLSNYFGY